MRLGSPQPELHLHGRACSFCARGPPLQADRRPTPPLAAAAGPGPPRRWHTATPRARPSPLPGRDATPPLLNGGAIAPSSASAPPPPRWHAAVIGSPVSSGVSLGPNAPSAHSCSSLRGSELALDRPEDPLQAPLLPEALQRSPGRDCRPQPRGHGLDPAYTLPVPGRRASPSSPDSGTDRAITLGVSSLPSDSGRPTP